MCSRMQRWRRRSEPRRGRCGRRCEPSARRRQSGRYRAPPQLQACPACSRRAKQDASTSPRREEKADRACPRRPLQSGSTAAASGGGEPSSAACGTRRAALREHRRPHNAVSGVAQLRRVAGRCAGCAELRDGAQPLLQLIWGRQGGGVNAFLSVNRVQTGFLLRCNSNQPPHPSVHTRMVHY